MTRSTCHQKTRRLFDHILVALNPWENQHLTGKLTSASVYYSQANFHFYFVAAPAGDKRFAERLF